MSDIAALFTWVNMRFLLQGLGMTLLISALAILCSVVLGTVISVMRTSNARVPYFDSSLREYCSM